MGLILYIFSLLRIAAVGDIMMGSNYPEPLLPPDSGKNLFKEVLIYLQNMDLVFGNLEGPITDFKVPRKKGSADRTWNFRTPPYLAGRLKEAGFKTLSIANNHAFDFGENGLSSTIKILDSIGISATGEPGSFIIDTVNDISLGIIAFSVYPYTNNLLDETSAIDLIQRISQNTDVLIISVHAGKEGENALYTPNKMEYQWGEPRGNVIKFSHLAIDNGADLILGHGPHVPRGIELYKNRVIAYSLGNFCVYGRFNLENPMNISFILRLELSADGTPLKGSIVPLYLQSSGIPEPDSEKRAISLLKKLNRTNFPETGIEILDTGVIKF